ncbi:MAG TPA: FAD/NAD(P)-binding oxidoreductase [Solirubrobacteraceae bacterium]|nr:FAD/NAD(P)-binding oxidoreductase [Solirubrobacteraceae bacterium]
MATEGPLNVLIAGGGVAGLEAALALRELAGDRVTMTLLAPNREFVYRPLRVREPFAGPKTVSYPLRQITDDIGVRLRADALKWLDPEAHVVHTDGGDRIPYDALLLALGARVRPRYRHALTIDDRVIDEQLHGLVQDIEAGYVHKLAFVSPRPMPWPLPLYELALLTAHRAYEMNEGVSITLITPEDAPLAVFGEPASQAVSATLKEAGILVLTSTHVEVPATGEVVLYPGGHSLWVDRVIALPELFGPSTPGVPKCDGHGFISVDAECRVHDLPGVFAAGDATDYELKHGSIAAHQADVAATGIARMAGAPVPQARFAPELHGILLGGPEPLYLSAHATGHHGSESSVRERPEWSPRSKIAARHLAPYLEALDLRLSGETASRS